MASQDRQPQHLWRFAPHPRAWLWLVALLTMLAANSAWAAAQVQLQVSANRLSVDEQLRVVISAAGDFDAMTELSSPGFEFSRAGTQTQVSIINGAMQRIESYTFLGTPAKPGKFTLGPVELLSNSNVVARSGAVEVEVVGEVEAGGPALSPIAASDLSQYLGKPFFVRPSLSVVEPYVGQAVVVTFELYWSRQVSIQGIRGLTPPRYGETDVQDLQKGESKAEAVQIGGRPYMRQLTHRVLLTPAKVGELRIDSPSFKVEIGDFFESKSGKATGPAVALKVRPLPEKGRPQGFSAGNVGSFALSGQLLVAGQAATRHKVMTGERLLLQYELSGDGNLLGLRDIAPPPLANMAVEALPGRPGDGVRFGLAGQTGKRTWQYVLSFSQPGTFTLPAMAWSHFDPATENYLTAQVGPFEIEVQGPALPGATAAAGQEKTGPAAMESPAKAGPATGAATVGPAAKRGPVRPLAAQADLAATPVEAWHNQRWVWGLLASPSLAALLWAFAALLQSRQARQAPLLRRKRAASEAKTALLAAQKHADTGAAYVDMRRILLDYLAQAAGSPPAQLSEREATGLLDKAGVTAELRQAVVDELSHCEYARYAPADNREAELLATAQRIAVLVERLDPLLLRAAPVLNSLAMALVAAAAAALVPMPAGAATLDHTFAEANRAYLAGEMPKAAKLYQELLEHKVTAPAVHYNLGNTLFLLGRKGAAVGHYRQALSREPDAALRQDIEANLGEVQALLGEQARRRHDTLHVFDETPALAEALARSAPRPLLILAGSLAGFVALGLWWQRSRARRRTLVGVLALAALSAHGLCAAWLGVAFYTDATVVKAVVVEEDEPLSACTGVGEPIGLPEGLEVRRLRELADGRVEVRLANGRQGCVRAAALYSLK